MQTVASIPQGKVTTYGEVARISGYPSYGRYVGSVLKRLPHNTKLPWHRVINAKGEISFPIGSEAHNRQLSLLTKEGIKSKDGKISMRIYGWSI